MSIFILIHGGAHGGWCWDRLVPELEARGHSVLAPDLPFMGDDPSPLSDATLPNWAAFVADLARRQGAPVILVGHSRGGPVISEAAELAPELFAGLVYLSAILVPAGKATMDMFDNSAANPLMVNVRMTDDQQCVIFDPESAKPVFYNTASTADADWAASRLCPDPVITNITPNTVTAERWGKVPRAYIECTEDRALPLASQRAMQAELPCDPVITLFSDHSPFLSIPGKTADALEEIAEAFARR